MANPVKISKSTVKSGNSIKTTKPQNSGKPGRSKTANCIDRIAGKFKQKLASYKTATTPKGSKGSKNVELKEEDQEILGIYLEEEEKLKSSEQSEYSRTSQDVVQDKEKTKTSKDADKTQVAEGKATKDDKPTEADESIAEDAKCHLSQDEIDAALNNPEYANLSREEKLQIATFEKVKNKEEIYKKAIEENNKNGVPEEVTNALIGAFRELDHSFEIGFNWEQYGDNNGDMLKFGGRIGDPWCDSFFSYLYGAMQGVNFKDEFPGANTEISVSAIQKCAINKGVYSPVDYSSSQEGQYEPVPGDAIVFKNGTSHIGMVVDSDDNYIYTIEGNADDAVRLKRYAKPGSPEYESGNHTINKVSGYIRMMDVYGGSSNIPATPNYFPEEICQLAGGKERTV